MGSLTYMQQGPVQKQLIEVARLFVKEAIFLLKPWFKGQASNLTHL